MLHLDTGNTAFMILCSSLVMLMTPGLAFFLRRPRWPEERLGDHDAELCADGPDQRSVGSGRL